MSGVAPARPVLPAGMTLRVIDERDMDAPTDLAIREMLCVCLPSEQGVDERQRAWHGSAPTYSALLEQGGRIVGHVGIVLRTILVGGEPLAIAGPQNVMLLPDVRGRGLLEPTMASAMDEARRRETDAGLLFCLPALDGVYRRCGWVPLPSRTVRGVSAEHGRYTPDAKNQLMYVPLRRAGFPDGDLDLQGDDW